MHYHLLFFCLLLSYTPTYAQKWDLAKDKSGVKVYTRKIEGWGIKQYKATVTIKTTLSKAQQTISTSKDRRRWLHNSIEVQEVARPSDQEVAIYNKVDVPWPVADRDNIVWFRTQYIDDKTIKITMESIKDHANAPKYDDVVRVAKIEGYWILKDKGNGTIEAMQQCVAEAGGSIPDWLANTSIVDNPYNTMLKFKQYLEGKL